VMANVTTAPGSSLVVTNVVLHELHDRLRNIPQIRD